MALDTDGPGPPTRERADRALFEATRPFARDRAARSWWLIASTFGLLGCVLTTAALVPAWPLRLAASIIGALMLARTFILYHDFLHGAILPGSRLARAIFYTYGAFNLTPSRYWRDTHNFHHANVGRIVGSDIGAFPLMTVEMWQKASRLEKLSYRAVRHPLTIVFGYVTIFLFGLCAIPLVKRPRRYWDSAPSLVAHAALIATLWYFGGFDVLFFALLLPMAIASAMGGYLFYAQHAFPGIRILPEQQWSRDRAALLGSSYLHLSRLMHWFTGNIGFHHVHHVNSLIPFYALPAAMAAIPELQHPVTTSLRPRDMLACFRANIWDEATGRMVRYRDVA